jgi:hypothetical protein
MALEARAEESRTVSAADSMIYSIGKKKLIRTGSASVVRMMGSVEICLRLVETHEDLRRHDACRR